MLDDHAAAYGSRTNWKYIMTLVLLAVLAMAGAFWVRSGAALPQIGGRKTAMDWRELPWNDGEGIEETASGVLGIAPERLWHMEEGGTITALLETEGEDLRPISGCAIGAWGKRAIYLWDGDDFHRIPVSGEILGCSGNDDYLAVTASASGAYTRTSILDDSGAVLGQVIPDGAAMAETAMTETRLGGLCLDTSGGWTLRLYDLDGQERSITGLPAGETYHLKAMEQGFAVLGDQSLCFYDENGQETGSYSFENGAPVRWDADASWAAVLIDCSGGYTLYTVDKQGNLLGTAAVPMPLRGLWAKGNRLYALDYQELRVYDTSCSLQDREECGARAAALAPADGAVWLLGNGEIARTVTK